MFIEIGHNLVHGLLTLVKTRSPLQTLLSGARVVGAYKWRINYRMML